MATVPNCTGVLAQYEHLHRAIFTGPGLSQCERSLIANKYIVDISCFFTTFTELLETFRCTYWFQFPQICAAVDACEVRALRTGETAGLVLQAELKQSTLHPGNLCLSHVLILANDLAFKRKVPCASAQYHLQVARYPEATRNCLGLLGFSSW